MLGWKASCCRESTLLFIAAFPLSEDLQRGSFIINASFFQDEFHDLHQGFYGGVVVISRTTFLNAQDKSAPSFFHEQPS
jgi:hypothetical protein